MNRNKTDRENTVVPRILVMDDEPIIQECLQELLEGFGYRVTVVADGAAAVTAYQQAYQEDDPFQLVIMDLIIPGGTGAGKAISLLQNFDSNLKAVVTSGDPHHEVVVNFRKYGFCGVLLKPIRLERVTDLLENTFGTPVYL